MSDSAAIILKSSGKIAPGVDGYGYAIADVLDFLDHVAKKLKVASLSSFLFEDLSLYEEFIAEDRPSKRQNGLSKEKKWHSCADGEKTFEALLGAFQGKGKGKWAALCEDEGVDVDDLRSDLKTCLKALRKAAERGDQFHLDLG